MQYERGDLVLIAFPFSSTTETKQRPALVLLDTGDEDILVARVTTQSNTTPFDVTIRDWKAAGLLAPSTIRYTNSQVSKSASFEKS
jgi:mRNA interferase MazF